MFKLISLSLVFLFTACGSKSQSGSGLAGDTVQQSSVTEKVKTQGWLTILNSSEYVLLLQQLDSKGNAVRGKATKLRKGEVEREFKMLAGKADYSLAAEIKGSFIVVVNKAEIAWNGDTNVELMYSPNPLVAKIETNPKKPGNPDVSASTK